MLKMFPGISVHKLASSKYSQPGLLVDLDTVFQILLESPSIFSIDSLGNAKNELPETVSIRRQSFN